MCGYKVIASTFLRGIVVGALWCAAVNFIYPRGACSWDHHLGHMNGPLFDFRAGWMPVCIGVGIGSILSLAYGRLISPLGAMFVLCSLSYVMKMAIHAVVAGWAHISLAQTWSSYLLVMAAAVFLPSGLVHVFLRSAGPLRSILVGYPVIVLAFLALAWWPINGDPYNPHRDDSWTLPSLSTKVEPMGIDFGNAPSQSPHQAGWYSTIEWKKLTQRDLVFIASIGIFALALPPRRKA